jgi:hypothetical protein
MTLFGCATAGANSQHGAVIAAATISPIIKRVRRMASPFQPES